MKNFIKIAPIVVALTFVSCKKDQTADQLVIEPETAQTTDVDAPVIDSNIDSNEELVKEAQSKPLTTIALSEAQFDFGKMKKGDHK